MVKAFNYKIVAQRQDPDDVPETRLSFHADELFFKKESRKAQSLSRVARKIKVPIKNPELRWVDLSEHSSAIS